LSPLTYIRVCKKVLQHGYFLIDETTWKLFKKGDKTSISNYRPTSLLNSFSKIIEKIMCKRLYSNVNINTILVKEQFGFRTNSSIEIAGYILINNMLQTLNNKLLVGGL
jgi:hypothetical protein